MELVQEKRKHVDKKGSGNLIKTKGKQRGKKVEKEDECSNLEIDPVQLHSKILVNKESEQVTRSKSSKESLTSVQPTPTTFPFIEEKVEKKASITSFTEEISSHISVKQELLTISKPEETNEEKENNIVIDIKPSKDVLISNMLLEEMAKSPLPQDSNICIMDQNKPVEIETGKKSQSDPEPENIIIRTDELKVALEEKNLLTNTENEIQSSNSEHENENLYKKPQIQIHSENEEPKTGNENDNESCQQSKLLENPVEIKTEVKEEISEKTEEIPSVKIELQNLEEKEPTMTNEKSSEKSENDNQMNFSQIEKDVLINPAAESPENKPLDLDNSHQTPQEEPELNDEKIPSSSETKEITNINHENELEVGKEKVRKLDEESLEKIKEEKEENSISIEKENISVTEPSIVIAIPEVVTPIPISFHPLTKIPTQLSYKITADNPHFEQIQIPRLNQQVKNNRTPFPVIDTGADDNAFASISALESEPESESNPLQISSSLTEEQRIQILQEPELGEFINIPEFRSQFKVPNYKILHLQNIKNGHKFQRTSSSLPREEKVPLPISWKKLSEDLGFECLDTEQDEAIAFYTMILWDDLLPPRPTVPVTPPTHEKRPGYLQNDRPAMSVMSDFFEERENLRRDSCMNGFRSESDTLIEKDSIYPENSWEYAGSGHQYCHQHYYSDSPKSRKNSSCHNPHCDIHQNYGYENPRHHHHQHHHHRHLVGTHPIGNPNSNVGRSEEAPLFRGKRCRVYTATAANIRTKTRLRAIKNHAEGHNHNPLENSEANTTTGAAPPQSSSSPWMKTKRMFSKARTVVRSAFRIKGGKTEDADDRNTNTNTNTSKNQSLKNGTDTNTNINGEKRAESDFFLPQVQDVNDDDKVQKSNNINTTQNDTQGMDDFMRDFYNHMDLIDEEMLLAAVQAPDPPITTKEAEIGIDSESTKKGSESKEENEGVAQIIDTNEGEKISNISISNNKVSDKK